ncbi:MAG: aminopeptidase P family protein [Chloroflexi bacterium]|nr:aminopeptidase P family protein [Chloroflexota bacterium]
MPTQMQLPQFSLAERDRRWRNIRNSMARWGLDCLVIGGHSAKWDSGMANVRYVSQVGGNGEEAYVVFPIQGEPTCYIWGGQAFCNWWGRAQDWVTDLRPRPGRRWSKAIVARLGELGLEEGRIGVVGLGGPMMGEPEGVIPYVTYSEMLAALPRAQFTNASVIVEEQRMIKGAEEIAFLERAAELADAAIVAMAETARPGVREYEVYAAMVNAMLKGGAEYPVMIVMDAGESPCQPSRLPTARKLEPGDVIQNEITARYGGYWAHPNRPVRLGEPRDTEYLKMFEACLASFDAGVEALRPGISAGEFMSVFSDAARRFGYLASHPIQGLGLAQGENPSFSLPGLVLEQNMVLALQPLVTTQDGKKGISLGETFVITSTGNRMLGKHPLEFIKV